MPISPLSFLWLIDPHDLQDILAKRFRELGFYNFKYYLYNMFRFWKSNMFCRNSGRSTFG